MCGRYTALTEDEIIEVRDIIKGISLRLARDEFDFGSYEKLGQEIAPTVKAPIVTSNGSELAFEHAQFGFEKWNGKGVIINARAETVKDKAMFKNRLTHGRCVIPASGYYEWKLPNDGHKKKIKHMIKDKQGNLLFMAGLWRDGKDGREFIVITKEPFGDVVNIHDRMPVMLRIEQLEAWLSGDMPIDALSSMDFDCIGRPCELTDEKEGNIGEQMTLF